MLRFLSFYGIPSLCCESLGLSVQVASIQKDGTQVLVLQDVLRKSLDKFLNLQMQDEWNKTG